MAENTALTVSNPGIPETNVYYQMVWILRYSRFWANKGRIGYKLCSCLEGLDRDDRTTD